MTTTAQPQLDAQDLRDDFEERAAILEYDAGMTRAEAEARAAELLQDRINAAMER